MKRCSAGTLCCAQSPNFCKISRTDSNYHFARKHSASKRKTAHDYQERGENFPSFHSLCQHKVQHKLLRINVEDEQIVPALAVDDILDSSLPTKLESCKQFFCDSAVEIGNTNSKCSYMDPKALCQ